MYHIPNDKRAKKSADLIADGLLACLKEKEFESVSISDINKKSYVSRATFYRLFDNTMDVVSYLCDKMFEDLIEAFSKREVTAPDEMTVFFLDGVMKHDLLVDILTKGNRVDILYHTHMKYIDYFYKFNFGAMLLTPEEEKYVAGILSSMLCSFITTWCREGKKESAEQLHQRIQSSVKVLGFMYSV